MLHAWIGGIAACSACLCIAEEGANKAIEIAFDALWCGVVALTTVVPWRRHRP